MKKFFVILFLMIMMCTVVYGATFDDIKGLNSEAAIDRLYYLGIVNGVSKNEYAPEKSVTRAELSKMIVNIVARESGISDKNFSDIQNHWGKDFILKAASLGILNGYTDGSFKPDNEVTYAEAIAIIMRCLGYDGLENNWSDVWYENYISKMKEINLNNGIADFKANDFANRGDIAILLWNMINSNSNGTSMLEKYFGDYIYWDNVKITKITTYDGKILYCTSKGNFFVNDDIDFSDLGANVSGFYDSKYFCIYGMEIDEGLNLKRISGNAKTIKEMGYDTFTCNNISGYGDKEYAKYIEVFIDEKTNKTVRVVFYDTRESYFAEKVKIGNSKVSIESKDVYDQSIVMLKDGKTITYNILRTESVKDIDINAILVYEGKVVNWSSIPNSSVIREIEKDMVYTYTNKYIDGKLDSDKSNNKKFVIENNEYVVSDDCFCHNTAIDTSMKLNEGLTASDIKEIAKNDEIIRIYLNEFNEVVKFEFTYDIWKMHELQERQEEYKKLKTQLDRIGIVTNLTEDYSIDDDKFKGNNLKILSLPKGSYRSYYDKKNQLKIGDFVYLPIKEKKKENEDVEIEYVKISNDTKFDGMKAIIGYNFEIKEESIGNYKFDSETQIIEVLLDKDKKNEDKYTKATLKETTVSELSDYTRYKSINLLVNENDVVIRLYAFKEIGNTMRIGIVNNIKEVEIEIKDKNKKDDNDEVKTDTKVYLIDENKKTSRYRVDNETEFSIGDIITFDIKKRNQNEKEDTLILKEIYRHEFIGHPNDLIVESHKSGKITFKNSEDIIDLTLDNFEYKGKKYNFDDYTIISAEVEKNTELNEWTFKYFSIKNKNKLNVKKDSRLVIDEITGTIVIYTGYSD